jgi:hypothetical protein
VPKKKKGFTKRSLEEASMKMGWHAVWQNRDRLKSEHESICEHLRVSSMELKDLMSFVDAKVRRGVGEEDEGQRSPLGGNKQEGHMGSLNMTLVSRTT